MKIQNTSSSVQLSKVETVLPVHIQQMNNQGWELMSVFLRMTGLEEMLFLLWKRTIDEPITTPENPQS